MNEQRNRRWPAMVRREVFERDRGVCAKCGLDTEALRRELTDLPAEIRREREQSLGWPAHRMDFWDADHTTPFAEGGACDLENIRTLCLPCHRRVTAEYMAWRGMPPAPLRKITKPLKHQGDPYPDGRWWIASGTETIQCPQCGLDTEDQPAVMAYVQGADWGGMQAKIHPAWPDRGWVVWRQCEHCSWMDWKTEYATLADIRRWKVGPWRPM